MRRDERKIMEKGTIGVLVRVLLQATDGMTSTAAQARQGDSMNLLGIIAGQQRPACRPATGGIVGLREPQPASR
jgi:hypothetical protein